MPVSTGKTSHVAVEIGADMIEFMNKGVDFLFYGKIISMFGNSFKNGKGLGNIMKMMMMSQMMGGGNSNNGGNNPFGQMMAYSLFFGGDKSSNPFDGMFDLEIDCDGDDEAENENDEEK